MSLGARDIRGDIKGRAELLRQQDKDRDRERDGDDDTWIFTYIKQGQYELKYVINHCY